MSNIDLAKVILTGMWQLACMVCWFQRGNSGRVEQCEKEFMLCAKCANAAFGSLDGMEDA